jgi:hypothetical protein
MKTDFINVSDVITAVSFARENELLLAMRGEGHNCGGLGSCDDGLVIDLSRMKGVRVDPASRTARTESGCTWAMSSTPRTLSPQRPCCLRLVPHACHTTEIPKKDGR